MGEEAKPSQEEGCDHAKHDSHETVMLCDTV